MSHFRAIGDFTRRYWIAIDLAEADTLSATFARGARMNEFQCWFCGEGIERLDSGAVMINIESLWRWADEARGPDDPWQSIYAHSRCTKDRMAGSTMNLEPSVFGEDD